MRMAIITTPEYSNSSLSSETYLCNCLTDHQLIEIMGFCGPSFNNLRCASSNLSNRVKEVSDYFLQRNYKEKLKPNDANSFTTMVLIEHPDVFKEWGRSRSSYDKEVLFGEACRTGDIKLLKHIMSIGVDIDAGIITSTGIPGATHYRGGVYSVPFSFVQEAIAFNHPDALEFLFKYGASTYINVCGTNYFLDNGMTDLYDFVSNRLTNSVQATNEIMSLITREYMIRKDYSIFFRHGWRSSRFLFPWIGTAIASIPWGTESKHGCNCQNKNCQEWSNNVLICNGQMLCKDCASKGIRGEKLTLANLERLLWIQPDHSSLVDEEADDETVFYGELYDYNMSDDESIDWDEPEQTQYGFYTEEEDEDALETTVEAYGY